MNNQCKINLGNIICNSRKSLGLSHRELCHELSKHGVQIDYCQLSKLENDRINVTDVQYDLLIHALCQFFDWNYDSIQIIRQQTVVSPPSDLSQGVFPIYMKDLI
jgi:transcriptional regulator with XRE-family HTH domain